VFGYLPNIPEAVTAMLSATSLGATWSSCGTDYQVDGLISRLKRVQPKVLFAATRYLWRGKEIDTLPIIEQALATISSIQHVVIVDYLSTDGALQFPENLGEVTWCAYSTVVSQQNATLSLQRFPFSHPLYIMFSSGTTGTPKGIVHSAGGTLLEQMKEMILHCDVRPGERILYQTSTSWMMWNWLVTGLACGASIFLYDGDPMLEDGRILWRMVDEEKVTHYGTSASFLHAIEKKGVSPNKFYSFDSLRAILSTGSTLHTSQFDYIIAHIKKVWIQSISGGTDILGCFALGCPWKPVVRGAIQSKSLGYDVRVFNEVGETVVEEEGELVCVAPAPSMPVGFLDDPDGALYREAYFNQYSGVWRHGDIVEDSASGLYFRGRSDATLKPGGVRIATADLYSVLGELPFVEHALAVGYTPVNQKIEHIVLFLVITDGESLDKGKVDEVKGRLRRSNLFYVPSLILQAPQVPRTTNNKLSEVSVKRILAGKEPGNSIALSNPEALSWYIGEGRRMVEDFFAKLS
jgi:acetoacetyl-CoA synthetase